MRFNLSRTMLLAAAGLVFGQAAYAQEINVRAHIPFSFVAGDKAYPAGDYAVQTAKANTFFLLLRNKDKTAQELIRSHPCFSTKPASPADKAKLVFHRMGNTYFLFRVWIGGSEVGREFPKSHLETVMAMNGSKTESVIVAASLAH